MGSRGPKPEGTPYEELPLLLRQKIERTIRASSLSTEKLFERFKLGNRGVSASQFKRIVARVRKATTPSGDPTLDREPEATLQYIKQRVLEEVVYQCDTGCLKLYVAAGLLRMAHDEERLDFERSAADRAQVLYDQRMEEWHERKAKADAEVGKVLRHKGLSDDAIDRILDIYGLARPGESELSGEGADGG